MRMSLLSDNLTNSSVPATISIAGPGFTNQETLRAICDCATLPVLRFLLVCTARGDAGVTKTHRMKCATAFVICTYSHRIHRIHPPIHPPIPCVRSPPSSPPSCHEDSLNQVPGERGGKVVPFPRKSNHVMRRELDEKVPHL